MQAARDGREDVVLLWLERLTGRSGHIEKALNECDEGGYTALHYAARFNRINIVQMLVNRGAGEKKLRYHYPGSSRMICTHQIR